MELVIGQQVYYSNKDWVPVSEIAASLIAMESIIKQSPEVFEALFPGTLIQQIDVYVRELRSDSIYEDLVVKFIFGSQENLDNFIKDIRHKVGLEKAMENPKVFGAVILAIIFIGGAYAIGKSSTNPDKKALIEANNNTIIQIGAEAVELDPDSFIKIIDAALKDRKKLAKDVSEVVKPAKRDSSATITLNDDPSLRIERPFIETMPEVLEPEEPEEVVVDYENLLMELRALDLDKNNTGWFVNLPEIGEQSTKRVRMQLDVHISRQELFQKSFIRGSATVVYRVDPKVGKVPKLVFLREIHKPKE